MPKRPVLSVHLDALAVRFRGRVHLIVWSTNLELWSRRRRVQPPTAGPRAWVTLPPEPHHLAPSGPVLGPYSLEGTKIFNFGKVLSKFRYNLVQKNLW